MRVAGYARKVHEVFCKEINQEPNVQYQETTTSAVFALQLNEPVYTLVIEPEPASSNTNANKEIRCSTIDFSISEGWNMFKVLSSPIIAHRRSASALRCSRPTNTSLTHSFQSQTQRSSPSPLGSTNSHPHSYPSSRHNRVLASTVLRPTLMPTTSLTST